MINQDNGFPQGCDSLSGELAQIQAGLRNTRRSVTLRFQGAEGRGACLICDDAPLEKHLAERLASIGELILCLELGNWRAGAGVCGEIDFDGLAPRITGIDHATGCPMDYRFEIEDLDGFDWAYRPEMPNFPGMQQKPLNREDAR